MKQAVTLAGAWAFVALALALSGCGGGTSGGAGSGGTEPPVVVSYSVGGSISGLGSAADLTLANGTETLPVAANATSFVFAGKLTKDTPYNVVVKSQPAGLTCTVIDGAGTVGSASVANINVACQAPVVVIDPPVAPPRASLALLAGNLGNVYFENFATNVSGFKVPIGIAVDPTGKIFVADVNAVRTIDRDEKARTFTYIPGYARGLAFDSKGNLFVADAELHVVHKITASGVVTIFAGTSGVKGSSDGVGEQAKFNVPNGLAIDTADQVYVADTANHTIRKISQEGVVSTLAGTANLSGSINRKGAAARFNNPWGIGVDVAANVYVADQDNHVVRKISPDGNVTTMAGTVGARGNNDGVGSAARFTSPTGVVVDAAGNVFVSCNNTIRKITAAGTVTTWAGSAGVNGLDSGTGDSARFTSPAGLTMDRDGNLYVADFAIRKITPAGAVTTLANNATLGGAADGSGAAARFNNPSGIAADSAGNAYVADTENHTIRKITPSGLVSTLAGNLGVPGNTDGVGVNALFNHPNGIAIDLAGNLFVSQFSHPGIRKIAPDGVVSTLGNVVPPTDLVVVTGSPPVVYLSTLAIDADSNIYFTGGSSLLTISGLALTPTVRTVVSPELGSVAGPNRFGPVEGMVCDSAGNVFVVRRVPGAIFKVTPAGVVTYFAGSSGATGHIDGTGAAVRFNNPTGIAIDSANNLYVADTGNNTIRKITPAGVVSTVVGTVGRNSFAEGPLPGILSEPKYLAISGRTLYITMQQGVAVVNNLP